jgi:hypothetical protein
MKPIAFDFQESFDGVLVAVYCVPSETQEGYEITFTSPDGIASSKQLAVDSLGHPFLSPSTPFDPAWLRNNQKKIIESFRRHRANRITGIEA